MIVVHTHSPDSEYSCAVMLTEEEVRVIDYALMELSNRDSDPRSGMAGELYYQLP